jgi:hypothetical protein
MRKPFEDENLWIETPIYLVSVPNLRGWLAARLREAKPVCVDCDGEGQHPCDQCDGVGTVECGADDEGNPIRTRCGHCVDGDVPCVCACKRDEWFHVEICGRRIGYEETIHLVERLDETRSTEGYVAAAGNVLLFEEKPLPRQRRIVQASEVGVDIEPWSRPVPIYRVEQLILPFTQEVLQGCEP